MSDADKAGDASSDSDTNYAPSGDNESDSDNQLQVIRKTKIQELLRDKTENQVRPEADELLIEKLNLIADVLATDAAAMADRNDGKTLEENEINDAFQNFVKPQNTIFRALGQVDKIQNQLQEAANSSPLSRENLNDRE